MPKIESYTEVFHVGHLDQEKRKPYYSQEGDGLSVSLHPDAWDRISSHVGGETYKLHRSDAEFYALDPAELPLEEHINWAVENNYVTLVEGYRVETPNGGVMGFYEEEPAQNESDEIEGAHGIDHEITTCELVKLSDRGVEYWEQAFCSDADVVDPIQVELLLPIWFAENTLNVDGVWWHNTLNPSKLSAPRGVIFQSQLRNWLYKSNENPEPYKPLDP